MTDNAARMLCGIRGIGTDIIEIERIKLAVERHGSRFLDRLFTEKEKLYCSCYQNPIPHFAGRFAAKEAVLKAFGTGLQPEMRWKEIEILNDACGKPEVMLPAELQQRFCVTHIFLSISHCDSHATATAVLIGHLG